MAKHTIKLPNGEWEYDDAQRLGKPGGFGEVFQGLGPHGKVAVKRLKLTASHAAHRELVISDELKDKDLKHVVQVLDAGQDAQTDRYFLVMPVCERSLQDEIDASPGKLDTGTIGEAVHNILSGLIEVGDLVHRDLKPANVLYHKGVWKIADFGIAKFVEDSTSMETLRDSLTPPYAAPEQWRGERPTHATDVYALGCIVHTLVSGRPPFYGSLHDIREGHLGKPPPPIAGISNRWATFVTQMLRKVPESRPTFSRCAAVLTSDGADGNIANRHPEFAQAAQVLASDEAKAEVEREESARKGKRRLALFQTARDDLHGISERLIQVMRDQSESVKVVVNEPGKDGAVKFGRGSFELGSLSQHYYEEPSRDVVASAMIKVTCAVREKHHIGDWAADYVWSATLFYGDLRNAGGYRWYETSFFRVGQVNNQPFAESVDGEFRAVMSGKVVDSVRRAYGPFAIDGEDEEAFQARWMKLLAKAATGQLRQPSTLPIPHGHL